MPRKRHTDVPWYAELVVDLIISAVAAGILSALGAPLPAAIVLGLGIGFGVVYCCLHIDWTTSGGSGSGPTGGDGFWAWLRDLGD